MVNTSGNSNDLNNINNINNQNNNTIPVTPTPTPSTIVNNDLPVTENPEDLDTRWTRWRCLVCNYTYEGREPLKKCPRCGNEDPDKFNDVD